MVASRDIDSSSSQSGLTVEQAHALEAAMASGSLRIKKPVAGRGGISAESIFKPGYQIASSSGPSSQGCLSPKIAPGKDQMNGF
ncbi:hypothetical protein TWF694_008762 [Orbilia ellipsospora]|uniref:SMP domain-containing protein n=1 Tax=Orbilia ellipsospora TaxID=2528407 RepID=A0AAV9XD05_9PEZI